MVSQDKAAALGIKAGVSLLDQAGTLTRIGVRLEGTLVGRAAATAARVGGSEGVASLLRPLAVVGSATFFIATELGLHSGDAK